MTKLAKLAGVLPFAHLLGVRAASEEERKDDDEEKEKAKGKKAKAADDDKPKDDDEDEEKEKKAKAEDDSKRDDDKRDEDKAKGKKAKAEDDDDEGDANAAVMRDRARCARIVAHGINSGSVRQACALAFDTTMSAEAAIATLDATAEDRAVAGTGSQSLRSRMEAERTPIARPLSDDDSGSGATDAKAIAGQILAAAAKARP